MWIKALLFLVLSVIGYGEIITTDRRITWQGNTGITNGIPDSSAKTIYTTVSVGASVATVQTALNNCPANQVVVMPSGAYSWSAGLDWYGVNSGVVLRGAGISNTVVTFTDYWPAGMYMRSGYNGLSTDANLSADATKGGTTLTLTSVPSWVVIGNLIGVDQLDDSSFVQGGGQEGNGAGYRELEGNGARGLCQLNRVLDKSSTTITLEIPLYYGFKTAQTAQIFQPGFDTSTHNPLRLCGVENMSLVGGFSSTDAHLIKMESCDSCYLKGVELRYMPGGDGVSTVFCYRCQFYGCIIQDCHLWGAGQAYGVALYHFSTACLIENCIFKKLHNSMTVNYGSAGNVFAYNYEREGQATSTQNPGMNTHGVHCYMNLWEGNVCEDKVLADWTHGSSSHNTIFRNRVIGTNGTTEVGWKCVAVEYYNRYWNIIGNVLGTIGQQNKYMCDSTSQTVGSTGTIFILGPYSSFGSDFSTYDVNSYTSGLYILLHGNWDSVQQTVSWESSIADHSIPNSYYLASKPTWFGDRPWPPIDSSSPTTAVSTNIPAGYRYFYGSEPPADGTPVIAVGPASHDYGTILVNTTLDYDYSVTNTGTGTLTGSASVSSPFSIQAGGTYSLGAGAYQAVTVRYAPTDPSNFGSSTNTITFTGGAGATAIAIGTDTNAPVQLVKNRRRYKQYDYTIWPADTFQSADGPLSAHLTTTGGYPWTSATGGILVNAMTNAPATAELLTNPGLEAPYSSGLANGWTKGGTPTLSQETTIITQGSSSQKFAGGAQYDAVYQTLSSSLVGAWTYYYMNGYHPTGDGGSMYLQINGYGSVKLYQITANSTWTRVGDVVNRITATPTFYLQQYNVGTCVGYLDDCSVRRINLTNCFQTLPALPSSDCNVKGWFKRGTTGFQCGIITHYDQAHTNLIMAYYDGNATINVDYCTNGVWGNWITGAKTYVDGAPIELRISSTNIACYYNNSQVGSDKTSGIIADFFARPNIVGTAIMWTNPVCTNFTTGAYAH
jgi:hypothetical protein